MNLTYGVQVDDLTKTCTACQKDLPLKDFFPHKNERLGVGGHCRVCTCSDAKLRRNDPETYRKLVEARAAAKLAAKLAAPVPDTKTCTKCLKDLSLTSFTPHKRGLYGVRARCWECEGAEAKAYRAKIGLDVYNEKRRKVWAENPLSEEKRKEAADRARAWYEDHREERLNDWATRGHSKEERAAAVKRAEQWALKHPNQVRESRRRAYILNCVRLRARDSARAALYSSSDFTFEDWESILEEHCHLCAYCLKSGVPLTMDHIEPISKGGSHTRMNIVPACRSCNSSKYNRPIFLMAGRSPPSRNLLSANMDAPPGRKD